MKALLTNYNQAPRKVRLVADLIRGKSVSKAQTALTFLPKLASKMMVTLLNSAVAYAGQTGYVADDLFIKKITVDKGKVLKRVRPFKQGRAGQMHLIMSHIALELGANAGATLTPVEAPPASLESKISEKTSVKKVAKKVAKKTSKKSK